MESDEIARLVQAIEAQKRGGDAPEFTAEDLEEFEIPREWWKAGDGV